MIHLLIKNQLTGRSTQIGKGTQSPIIKDDCCLCHLATGDMLRAVVSTKTPIEIKVKEAMEKGELVTDNLVVGIIDEAMKRPSCQKGEGSVAHSHPSCGFDPLSRVGNNELKLHLILSQKFLSQMTNTLGREVNNHKKEMAARFVQPVPHTIVSDTLLNASVEVLVPNKLID
ncbi:hypothetical protein IFM89_038654 [Coptis chinensis]|uniref:adenylate kinase n=1 Tax=Coptis chinensis TaxID=261450 RepID=A0A835M0V3_9MAGN|nr:hypothetical protein IFM89_038654 [Coptis chinensis]